MSLARKFCVSRAVRSNSVLGQLKSFDSKISNNDAEANKPEPDARHETDNWAASLERAKTLISEPLNEELSAQDHQDLESLVSYWVQQDLSYATNLIYRVLDYYDVKLSNEVWSVYVSRVCEECHLEGAQVVFHELIDNWKLFEGETSPSSCVQTHFAFLLTPTMLEGLSIIFQRNGQPDYVLGLRDYFKRFYSVYGHRTSYKTINISLVEAYSVKQELGNALSAFKYICMMFRDHKTFVSRSQFLEVAHTTAKGSYDWRIKNLRTNRVKYPEYEYLSPSDLAQKKAMDEINGELYDPINTHNDTTRPVPILNGSLQLNDLPNFSLLLDQYVVKHMEKNDEDKIHKLMQTIQQNHFMLNSFIIHSLAVNFYLEEALIVMKKLPYKYHDVLLPALLKEDMFLVVMKSCKAKISVLLTNELSNLDKITELTQLMNSIMNFYYRVIDKTTSKQCSPKIVEVFLSTMLSTPRLSTIILSEHLERYRKTQKQKFLLNEESFANLADLFDIDVYKQVVASRAS